MNRLPDIKFVTLRRLLTVAACASVLLTSFQDEVLLATTIAATSERDEAGPLPRDGDGEATFPDLSRTDNGERFHPSIARAVPAVRVSPQSEPPFGIATGARPTSLVSSLCALFCVWRI